MKTSKKFGDVFTDAIEVLAEKAGPLLGAFLFLHVIEDLPNIVWQLSKRWVGEHLLGSIADTGAQTDQSAVVRAIFGQASNLMLGFLALVVLLVLLVLAYTFVFGKVIGTLRGKEPAFGQTMASLGVFGLLPLTPYAIFSVGIAILVLPMLSGAAWNSALLLPVLACGAAGVFASVAVQPMFYCTVATGAVDDRFGMAAFGRALEVVRKNFGDYLLLAVALVAIGMGVSLVVWIIGLFIPAGQSESAFSLLTNPAASVDKLMKQMTAPDGAPNWAAFASTAVDIAGAALRDAYACVVVTLWYQLAATRKA